MRNRLSTCLTIAALICGRLIAGALPAAGPVTRPATSQVTPPDPLNVEGLKLVGMLGNPRFLHAGIITHISVVNHGTQVLSAAADGTARLWDAGNGKELHRFTLPERIGRGPWSFLNAQLLPDGKRLLTGGDDWQITLWDVETGQVIRRMPQGGTVEILALTPDGKYVFAGGFGSTLKQWDIDTGKWVRDLAGFAEMHSAAISPDGKNLIAWDNNQIPARNQILVWDIANGQPLPGPDAYQGVGGSLVFSAQGDRLASLPTSNKVRLSAAATGKELWQVTTAKAPGHLAFSSDGQMLAYSSADGIIHLLRASEGTELRSIDTHGETGGPVAFSSDGKTVLSALADSIGRWDTSTGQRVSVPGEVGPEYLGGNAEFLAVSPAGDFLYAAGDGPGIYAWNPGRGTGRVLYKLQGEATSLALSPDGRLLLVGQEETSVVLDATTGQRLRQVQHRHEARISLLDSWAWAGNKAIASGSDEAPLEIWNIEDGSSRLIDAPHDAGMRQYENIRSRGTILAVSDDGRRAILADVSGGRMEFWSLLGEARLDSMLTDEIPDFRGRSKQLSGIGARFVPGGPGLLTVSAGDELEYWNRGAGVVVSKPADAQALAQWVKNLGASDYRARDEAMARLIDAGLSCLPALAQADMNDPEVVDRLNKIQISLDKLWIPDRRLGRPLQLPALLSALAMHPDGRHWAAIIDVGSAAQIVLGELTPQGPQSLRRIGADNSPCGLVFSPDGKTLYVGNENATISVYEGQK